MVLSRQAALEITQDQLVKTGPQQSIVSTDNFENKNFNWP